MNVANEGVRGVKWEGTQLVPAAGGMFFKASGDVGLQDLQWLLGEPRLDVCPPLRILHPNMEKQSVGRRWLACCYDVASGDDGPLGFSKLSPPSARQDRSENDAAQTKLHQVFFFFHCTNQS